MKKLKVKNVILFILSMSMILHDMYILAIKHGSFTWIGFITFILFCAIADLTYEDFKEQIKRVLTLEPVTHSSK